MITGRRDDRTGSRFALALAGGVGIALPLAEIYDGVTFTRPPRPSGRDPNAPA